MEKLNIFSRGPTELPVSFVESQGVKAGVTCDVYAFPGDASRDLGVVMVTKGHKTPLQKVLKGDNTIEGFLDGSGMLTVTNDEGTSRHYRFPNSEGVREVLVHVGEIMQWEAIDDLVFYEICEPPYEDGRFQNLDSNSERVH